MVVLKVLFPFLSLKFLFSNYSSNDYLQLEKIWLLSNRRTIVCGLFDRDCRYLPNWERRNWEIICRVPLDKILNIKVFAIKNKSYKYFSYK